MLPLFQPRDSSERDHPAPRRRDPAPVPLPRQKSEAGEADGPGRRPAVFLTQQQPLCRCDRARARTFRGRSAPMR